MNQTEIFAKACSLNIDSGRSLSPKQLHWLEIASKLGTISFIKNHYNDAVGYIIWCFVTEESLNQLGLFNIYPRFFYEYHEGEYKLILDVLNLNKSSPLDKASIVKLIGTKHFYGLRRSGLIRYQISNNNLCRKKQRINCIQNTK